MRKKVLGAFTLTELIVVVVILSILSTIGFLSYLQMRAYARDSLRKADISSMQRALEYYRLDNGIYPDPTDYTTVTYEGYSLWKQGSFGKGTKALMRNISGELKDPKYNIEYPYSTTHNNTEYQVSVVYEGHTIPAAVAQFKPNLGIPQTYADNAISEFDPSSIGDVAFWFDGGDVDADGIRDSDDTSIPNVGIVENPVLEPFSPFYFDRSIWLDAQQIDAAGTDFVESQQILSWENRTGQGYNGFVPLTGNTHTNPSHSTPPTYSETGFNGHPGVYFDGVDNGGSRIVIDRGEQPMGVGFTLGYTFMIDDSSTAHASIISVGPTGGGAYHPTAGAWQLSRDGLENYFIFRIRGAIDSRDFEYVNCTTCSTTGNGEIAFSTWDEVNDNMPHSVIVTYEGRKVTGYLDGTKRFEATMSTSTEPFGEYFRLFGNRASTAYLEGMLGEVFISNDRVGATEINMIEGYLAHKWGYADNLRADHPYKSGLPDMDIISDLLYTRHSLTQENFSNYGELQDDISDSSLLNTLDVRYAGSMPGMNLNEDYKIHVWKGPIKVSESGNYTFSTESDDASFVIINDQVLISNMLDSQKITGMVNLTANQKYDFALVYVEIDGESELNYGVEGPGAISYRKYASHAWNDKSDNQNNLVQPTQMYQPTYNSADAGFIFGDEDVMDFSSLPFAPSDSLDIYFVVSTIQEEDVDIGSVLLENNPSPSAGQMQLATKGMRIADVTTAGESILNHGKSLISYRIDRNLGIQRYLIDGNKVLENSVGGNITNGNYTLGSSDSILQGTIYEAIAFTKRLTDDQRNQIEGYFAHKWGFPSNLSIDHDYYEPPLYTDISYVQVEGDYNGVALHTNSGDDNIIVATPSILSSITDESSTVDFTTIIGENKLVYNGYTNLPSEYAKVYTGDSDKFRLKDGFYFGAKNPKVFEGSKEELQDFSNLVGVDKKIRALYKNQNYYKAISKTLSRSGRNYLENSVSRSLNLKNANPKTCMDLQEDRLGTNILFLSKISGNSGEDVSSGKGSLGDGYMGNEDYTYLSNPGEDPTIILNWEEAQSVSLIRLHNSYGDFSSHLWQMQVQLLDEEDQVLYESVIGNSDGVGIIDVTVPAEVQTSLVSQLRFIPSVDFDQIALREIEVFAGAYSDSGEYTINKQNIYCDMSDEGGAWTRSVIYIKEHDFTQGHHQNLTGAGSNYATISSGSAGLQEYEDAKFLEISSNSVESYTLHADTDITLTDGNDHRLRMSIWLASTTQPIFVGNLNYADNSSQSFYSQGSIVQTDGSWNKFVVKIDLQKDLDSIDWNIGEGISSPFQITLPKLSHFVR